MEQLLLLHHLVVVPDVGVDVVDVPGVRLLDDPLHHPLGHPLPEEGSRCRPEKEKLVPPVSVQGPDEAKVEAVILRQLTAHRPSLGNQGAVEL